MAFHKKETGRAGTGRQKKEMQKLLKIYFISACNIL
jgi:hypothetical protein